MDNMLQQDNLTLIKKMLAANESDESLTRSIAEFVPALLYTYDAQSGKVRFINKKAADILGYSEDEISDLNNDLSKLIFEEDQELVRSELQSFSILNDDASRAYYSRYKHKLKNWRYLCTQGTILKRDENGVATSLLFMAQEVDETMEYNEGKALKALFRETEELLHFGTWMWFAKSNQLEWSNGMYAIMEYEEIIEKEAMTNEFFHQHIPEPYRNLFIQKMEQLQGRDKEFELHFPLITKKGNKKLVSTKAKYVFDNRGDLQKVIGVTHDITSQSRTLKDLSDYKQAMLDKERFLSSGSWELDIKSRALSWSDGKYRLFGYDTDDRSTLPVVTHQLYAKHVTPAELDRLKEIWNYVEFFCEDEHRWEYELTTVQGERKIIESYARVVKDEEGHRFKVIGASRDVTQMREYEESLKRKIEELDRSNKDLEEFAYIASHDLQEPLRKITAFSERLKERARMELSEESVVYLDRMLTGTSNMRMLIDNLLEFSRTSRHNQPFQETDLGSILENAKAELELKIEETGAIITSQTLPVIEAIPSQVHQLMTNLISNAIKFRKPGEVPRIDIRARALTAAEKSSLRLPEANYFKLQVNDNGIGFEQEYADRIFQIFQRLHGKSEYPGSGIGLAICKKIAENHSGFIIAQSEPGKGARFITILPEKQP